MKKIAIFVFIILLSFSFSAPVKAQCSMCTINAEQSTKNGNTQGKGLNSGIIYLLVIPYILMTGIGVLWYRNYRKGVASTPVNN